MTLNEKTEKAALRDVKTGKEEQRAADEVWENCKGQCGFTPWCRDCQLEKEKLHKEWLNRQGRSDDKEE